MADETLELTTPFQLTKTIRRDPYEALSPTNPELSAAGKVIIVTGGGTGLGAVSLLRTATQVPFHLTDEYH